MVSIVERLQSDALKPDVAVSNLLRQVKLIAAKLDLGKVEDWVEHELNGYKGDEIPDYRIVTGAPKAFNPYNGWIPIVLDNLEMMRVISQREIGQKISELEDLLKAGDETTLQIPFPQHVIADLNRGAEIPFAQMALLVGRATVVGIIDSVRNKILDWAIALEKTGIKGSEVSFTSEEKNLAQQPNVTMHIGSIGNFVGNLGVGNSAGDIAASIDRASVESLVKQVRQLSQNLIDAGVDSEKLQNSLENIATALKQRQPNQNNLRSLLTDLRGVVTGAAGNLVATGVVQLINQILGTGVPST